MKPIDVVTRDRDRPDWLTQIGEQTDLALLAVSVPVVHAKTALLEVDAMLRADPQVRGVLVQYAGGWQLLGRHRIEWLLTGRFGYGRALHGQKPVASMLPVDTLVLTADMSVSEAARRLLDRDPSSRFDDAVIEGDGAALVIPPAAIFAGLAGNYRQAALTDALTGLPNRLAVHDFLNRRATERVELFERLSLLYVDLDHFKGVNDTFGHRAGDELLVQFATRLRACIGPEDLVARLGGDEFAVLLRDVDDSTATAVADRIVLSAAAPFILAGCIVTIGASVGIATSGSGAELHVESVEVLLRHADDAMYRAKMAGRSQSAALDPSGGVTEPELGRRLRDAVESGGLHVVYQPKVTLATGQVLEQEALCRWTDPHLGVISPAQFIPVAEKNGLMGPLGRWVLAAACRQAKSWLDAGTPMVVAVNISAVQIATDELVRDIADTLASAGLPAQLLRLELTETAALIDIPTTARRLTEIRATGVLLSLDDFGTGYSSLSLLHNLPVHEVKIDKSFVDNVDTDPAAEALIAMIIDGAHRLGLTVIAEGVERDEQLRKLCALGCDAAQGYLLGYPSAIDAPRTSQVTASV